MSVYQTVDCIRAAWFSIAFALPFAALRTKVWCQISEIAERIFNLLHKALYHSALDLNYRAVVVSVTEVVVGRYGFTGVRY